MAALMPLFFFIFQGYQPSISNYWETPMQPFFIIINASTSYHLYGIKNWRFSAVFLLFLTAFSVTDFQLIHNIVAVLFFIYCLYPLYITKRYEFMFWVYLLSLPLMFFDILLGESLAVLSLCIYHGLVLLKVNKLSERWNIFFFLSYSLSSEHKIEPHWSLF